MARETFLQNLQTAAFTADRQAEIAGSHPSGDQLTQLQSRCDLWLTPKTVEDFAPEDFPELSSQKRHELQQEVKGFLAAARSVPADAPATKRQVKEAFTHFQHIIGLVREAVLVEWRQALERLFKEVEDWCAERNWAVQRNAKQISDTVLGEYEVPSLLIHTKENVRYLMTPTARFIAGGTGRVDMCLWPSFNDVGIVRVEDSWYVIPLRGGERRKRWSREAFLNLAAQLAKGSMNKQPEWFERIKAVVREHQVAEVGLGLIDEAARAGKKPLPDPLKVSDLNKTRGNMEGTYLIRLFAVFESGLRDAWLNAFGRRTRPKTEDLMNGIAAIRRIPKEQLDRAHEVRGYRNAVVHEGNERAEPISLEQARSYLSQYFSWLPLSWLFLRDPGINRVG